MKQVSLIIITVLARFSFGGTRRLSNRLDTLETNVAKIITQLETMKTNQELTQVFNQNLKLPKSSFKLKIFNFSILVAMLENQRKIPTISSCCSNVEANVKNVKTKIADLQTDLRSSSEKAGRDLRIAHRRTRDTFSDKLAETRINLYALVENKTEEVLAQSNAFESNFQGQASLIRKEIGVVKESIKIMSEQNSEAIEDQTKQLAIVQK